MATTEKIYFDEDTAPIIFSILEKYSIKDSNEKFLERLEAGKLPQGVIIIDSVEKLFVSNAKDDEILPFLKNGLEITDQLASQILADIKEKLLPIAKKYTPETKKEEVPEKIATPQMNNISVSVGVPEPLEPSTSQPKPKIPRATKKSTEPTPEDTIKKEIPESPKKSDTYREPIE
jgi:translation elongation factor EF-1alpha